MGAGRAVSGTGRDEEDISPRIDCSTEEGLAMKPGMYRDKNGELCLVSLTVNGGYRIDYADGRVIFV